MADFDATRQVMGETNSLSPREQDAWNRAAEMEARYDRLTVDYARKCDEIERLLAGGKMKPELPPLPTWIRAWLSPEQCDVVDQHGLACYRAGQAAGQAERDALKALLNRAREALDDEIGGYRKWPNSVGGKLLLDLDAAIDAARSKP